MATQGRPATRSTKSGSQKAKRKAGASHQESHPKRGKTHRMTTVTNRRRGAQDDRDADDPEDSADWEMMPPEEEVQMTPELIATVHASLKSGYMVHPDNQIALAFDAVSPCRVFEPKEAYSEDAPFADPSDDISYVDSGGSNPIKPGNPQ